MLHRVTTETMKINNLTSNNETVTVDSVTMVVPAGSAVDLGFSEVVVRGNTYVDGETNLYTINVGPSGLAVIAETSPLHEFEQGMQLGMYIGAVLIIVLLLRKYFVRGDSFD